MREFRTLWSKHDLCPTFTQNNRLRNLRSLCQRCHVLHDVPHHTRQRWLTYRRRWAAGDLFLGPYAVGTMILETAR
jgi:hypothetical protein